MPSDDRIAVSYALPPAALQGPAATEAWYQALPPDAKAVFQLRVGQIARSLPPVTKLNLQRALISGGFQVPAELSGLGGLGALGDDAGGYGALIGTLIGSGAALYDSHQANSTAISINNSTNAANANIASIMSQGNVAINRAFADAQVAAAAFHAQTTTSIAPTIAKWSAIGVVGLGVVGIGAWLLLRKRK